MNSIVTSNNKHDHLLMLVKFMRNI